MIEPATASLAVYLLTKTTKVKPLFLKKNHFIIKENYVNGLLKINIR
jgi:hypothetical protein